MNDSPAIRVENLERRFGDVRAVDGLSFEVGRGEVVGFIGANGAGKTTTMRILATLDLPDGGRAEVGGNDVADDPQEVRRMLGWVPDAFAAYNNLSVAEYVDFFARAHGFAAEERRNRVGEVLAFTGLDSLAARPASRLSKGQSQRLCLCRALLHDPEILILDEPAAGLDPQARLELRQLIRILAGEGRTLLISSHILSELGEMCQRLLFIHDGRLLHDGSAETLKRKQGRVLVEIRVVPGSPDPADILELQPGVTVAESLRDGVRVSVADDRPETLSRLLRQVVAAGLPVMEFRVLERNLEDAFVEMLGDTGGGESASSPSPSSPA